MDPFHDFAIQPRERRVDLIDTINSIFDFN